MSDNPFEVLRLDPTSSEEEVVRQAGRLRQRAHDEATLDAVRQAVQTLTASPSSRRLAALLTHPRPSYHAPELERFVSAFRRPPLPATPPEVPPADPGEVARLLGAQLAPPQDFTPLPLEVPDADEPAEEIRRQTAEAMWQSLLNDPRA
jgi:hypothetical protein